MNSPIISMYSVIGKRSANEDRCLEDRMGDLLVYGVFDGHSGGDAAELARQVFMTEFTKCFHGQNISVALKQTFENINTLITIQKIEGGTTATIAVVDDDLLTIAHVGDSKAVLYRGGQPVFETKPHVLTNTDELTNYRSSNWFNTKSRLVSQGKIKGFKLSAVSRSLGDTFFEDALSPIPDVTEQKLLFGDILIIATDGLWNFVATESVLETALGCSNQESVSEELVTLALRSGTTDNVSAFTLQW